MRLQSEVNDPAHNKMTSRLAILSAKGTTPTTSLLAASGLALAGSELILVACAAKRVGQYPALLEWPHVYQGATQPFYCPLECEENVDRG